MSKLNVGRRNDNLAENQNYKLRIISKMIHYLRIRKNHQRKITLYVVSAIEC